MLVEYRCRSRALLVVTVPRTAGLVEEDTHTHTPTPTGSKVSYITGKKG